MRCARKGLSIPSSIKKLPTPLAMSQYPAVDRGFKGGGGEGEVGGREECPVARRVLGGREDGGGKGWGSIIIYLFYLYYNPAWEVGGIVERGSVFFFLSSLG